MIKTITATDKEEFDKAVNDFEKQTSYKTGVTRCFATQTHCVVRDGQPTVYVAVVFYKEGQ